MGLHDRARARLAATWQPQPGVFRRLTSLCCWLTEAGGGGVTELAGKEEVPGVPLLSVGRELGSRKRQLCHFVPPFSVHVLAFSTGDSQGWLQGSAPELDVVVIAQFSNLFFHSGLSTGV